MAAPKQTKEGRKWRDGRASSCLCLPYNLTDKYRKEEGKRGRLRPVHSQREKKSGADLQEEEERGRRSCSLWHDVSLILRKRKKILSQPNVMTL